MTLGVDTTFLVQLEIRGSAGHEKAKHFLKSRILSDGKQLALAPQVLTEFLHVVTDSKRFENPLSMQHAIEKAYFWWHSKEVLTVFPEPSSPELLLRLLAQHRLGRKRILDTMLLATYIANGINTVITSNKRDYSEFEGVTIIDPLTD